MTPRPTVYVGTESGLYALTYVDQQWLVTSLGLSGKNVVDLAVPKEDPAVLLALVKGYGLFQTENGGRSWQQICAANAHCMLVDATDGRRLWLGKEPAGVLRSLDGGQTWQDLSDGVRAVPGAMNWSFSEPPYQPQVRTLAQVPGQPNSILAGITDGGTLKSLDGGQTWTLTQGEGNVHGLAVHSDNPDFWLAAGDGLYFSEDGGHSWAETDAVFGYCSALAMFPSGLGMAAIAASPPGNWVENAVTGLFELTVEDDSTWHEIVLPFSDYVTDLVTDRRSVYAATSSGRVYLRWDMGMAWQEIADLAVSINKMWTARIG